MQVLCAKPCVTLLAYLSMPQKVVRSGDNMNLRGFYTFGDMYLDGVRDTAQYNREVFNLEQVDVLRGAADHAVWPRASWQGHQSGQ